jgi:hypothetical protein
VGGRDASSALVFMKDVGKRLANGVQMTTDGRKAYLDAVDDVFGVDIHYGVLVVKACGTPEGAAGRYSPGDCTLLPGGGCWCHQEDMGHR